MVSIGAMSSPAIADAKENGRDYALPRARLELYGVFLAGDHESDGISGAARNRSESHCQLRGEPPLGAGSDGERHRCARVEHDHRRHARRLTELTRIQAVSASEAVARRASYVNEYRLRAADGTYRLAVSS